MTNFKIKSTLINKPGVLCFTWATIQQMVVACSTYFIIEAIQYTTSQNYDMALKYIVLFVATLVIVYVPNTISLVYLQAWRLSSFANFVSSFIRFNEGKTTLAHSRQKSKFESWLTNEGSQVYDESTSLLYQVYSTFLNSALNIAVIAFVIDQRILGWYLGAGAVLLVSNKVFQKYITRVSLDVQQTRKGLANTMLTSWDNIFTGNSYNLNNWKDRFSRDVDRAKKSAVNYDVIRSVISSVTVSVALAIIAIGNGIFLFENQQNVTAMAALIITLPRQVQIVQNIFAFFNIYLSWKGVSSRLDELEGVIKLSKRQSSNPVDFVSFDKISLVNGERSLELNQLSEFLEITTKYTNGRFTLRASNGAGKSTLLSLLSEETAAESFFLPSNFIDLSFASNQVLNDSDGNRILSVFDEISTLNEVGIVLLDEWDANLDDENIKKIDLNIEELAKTKVVIESRHRK